MFIKKIEIENFEHLKYVQNALKYCKSVDVDCNMKVYPPYPEDFKMYSEDIIFLDKPEEVKSIWFDNETGNWSTSKYSIHDEVFSEYNVHKKVPEFKISEKIYYMCL